MKTEGKIKEEKCKHPDNELVMNVWDDFVCNKCKRIWRYIPAMTKELRKKAKQEGIKLGREETLQEVEKIMNDRDWDSESNREVDWRLLKQEIQKLKLKDW